MFLIHYIFLLSTIDMATVKVPCACFDKNPFIYSFICVSQFSLSDHGYWSGRWLKRLT